MVFLVGRIAMMNTLHCMVLTPFERYHATNGQSRRCRVHEKPICSQLYIVGFVDVRDVCVCGDAAASVSRPPPNIVTLDIQCDS